MSKIEILETDVELSQTDLCRVSGLDPQELVELVGYGVLEPNVDNHEQWLFSGVCVTRARIACRLQRDLGVNVAGAALAMELLDELKSLRLALQRYSPTAVENEHPLP